jgi:hypothetical protein
MAVERQPLAGLEPDVPRARARGLSDTMTLPIEGFSWCAAKSSWSHLGHSPTDNFVSCSERFCIVLFL